MKKLLASLTMLGLFGIPAMFATDFNLVVNNGSGVTDAYTHVTVTQYTDLSSTSYTQSPIDLTGPSTSITMPAQQQVVFIVSPETGYFLNDYAEIQPGGPLYPVIATESNLNTDFQGFDAKVGDMMIRYKAMNGELANGTTVSLTLDSQYIDNTPQPTTVPVTFNLPVAGLIESVLINNSDPMSLSGSGTQLTGSVNFAADYKGEGAWLTITFTSGYNVESATITYSQGGQTGSRQIAVDSAETVNIEVLKTYTNVNISFTLDNGLDYYNFTLNVNGPVEGVVATDATDETEYELTGATNNLTIGKENILTINAAPGYEITSVTNGSGVAIPNYDTRINVTEGMVINVAVEAISGTPSTFYVNLEEADPAVFTNVSYTTNGMTYTPLSNLSGSNAIEFYPSQNLYYQVVATPTTADAPLYTYLNGVNLGGAASSSNVYYGIPYNGLEIDVYVNRPKDYAVNFIAENAVNTEVTANGYALNNWDSGMSDFFMLENSTVDILAPANLQVYLNGDLETATSTEGNRNLYSFTITANSTFEILGGGASTGIDTLDSENGVKVIYNLQGVRVNGENLPAGIYVINGRKTVVK